MSFNFGDVVIYTDEDFNVEIANNHDVTRAYLTIYSGNEGQVIGQEGDQYKVRFRKNLDYITSLNVETFINEKYLEKKKAVFSTSQSVLTSIRKVRG